MDSKRLRDLREAYGAIYEPEVELTEEQVWEEVETWVSSLLEEGYDLSDYTWEELYEEYLNEILGLPRFGASPEQISKWGKEGEVKRAREAADRATNQRAQLGVVKTNKGYIAKPGATSYDPNKGAEAIRLAARLNKETGSGRPKPATPLAKPPAPILPPPAPVLPAASSAGSAPSRTPAAASPRPAASSRPAATPAAQPKPAAPTGPAIGKLGSTSFERRTPTSAELKAAQAARAGGASPEKALQAAQKTNLPTTGPTPAIPSASSVSSSMASFKPRDMTKNPLKPTAPTTMKNSYEWGSTSKLVDGIANAYSSIYEAKKVDQDKDGDNDFADVRIARLIASGVSKEEAIRRVKDKSYNEEVEIDEATRMRKELGKEGEIATRKELTSRSKAYQRSGSVDRTIAAAERGAKNPYVARGKNETEAEHNQRKQGKSQTLTRLAANRRKSVRNGEGLRGYAAKVEGSDKDLQSARGSARSAGTLTPAEKKGLGEDFELWVNQLVEEGYDLSDYTWDEMAEIYEETELEKKKAKEAAIAARRARVAELQSQGRVMTSTKRTRGAAAERKEQQRADALERAANAILRQTTGYSGKVSDKPMGSQSPAPKEEAPEANRRLKTGLRRDTLGTAADDALKGKK